MKDFNYEDEPVRFRNETVGDPESSLHSDPKTHRRGSAVLRVVDDSFVATESIRERSLPDLSLHDGEDLLGSTMFGEIRILTSEPLILLNSTKQLIAGYLGGRGGNVFCSPSHVDVRFRVASKDLSSERLVREFGEALVELFGLPRGTEVLSRVESMQEGFDKLPNHLKELFRTAGL